MTCNDVENLLPAHMEDLLAPEERRGVEEHLASCPRCRRVLTDLMTSVEVLRGLEEVEPPPFFEERIMARIREAAGQKRGFLRKLFFPLHIKLPIQTLAMIFIAVLGIHVYRQGEPEMKQIAPLPEAAMESVKRNAAADSPPAPSIVPAPRQRPSPAAASPASDGQHVAAAPGENGGKAVGAVAAQARAPEGLPAEVKPDTPDTAPRRKGGSPSQAGGMDEGPPTETKQQSRRMLETPLPEAKRKENRAETSPLPGEGGKPSYAPAPSAMRAAKATSHPVMALTIQVDELSPAVREIEKRLNRAGARVIARQHHGGSESVQAEMPAANVAAFLEGLGTIGRVKIEQGPVSVLDGNVAVKVTIAGSHKNP